MGLDSNNDLLLLGDFNYSLEIDSGDFSFSAQANEKGDIFLAKILDILNTNTEELNKTAITISPNPCSNFLDINIRNILSSAVAISK